MPNKNKCSIIKYVNTNNIYKKYGGYLYYCMSGKFGNGGYYGPISVAVCDTPAGKYEYLGFIRNPDGTPMKKYVCFEWTRFSAKLNIAEGISPVFLKYTGDGEIKLINIGF